MSTDPTSNLADRLDALGRSLAPDQSAMTAAPEAFLREVHAVARFRTMIRLTVASAAGLVLIVLLLWLTGLLASPPVEVRPEKHSPSAIEPAGR